MGILFLELLEQQFGRLSMVLEITSVIASCLARLIATAPFIGLLR
jgi:hypothetical protein